MMRLFISTILIAVGQTLLAQSIYTTDSSLVRFFSSTPLEDIEAYNAVSTSLLNVPKNEVVFRVPITGFQFEKPLMQEHFNENYMESNKYPYGTFKGKLSDSLDLRKDTIYKISATGIMNIHGVDNAETYTGTIETKDGKAMLKCEFKVALRDYRIRVPKVVFANVAEEIDVKVYFEYRPYEKK
jgi:hypothetical protein